MNSDIVAEADRATLDGRWTQWDFQL